MERTITKFVLSIIFLIVLAIAIGNTKQETWLTTWSILFFLIALPIFVVSWIDMGKSLRNIENPSTLIRIAAILCSVPQVLFGIMSLLLGVMLISWVVYNTIIEAQSEYSGGFFTFGLGPGLVLIGIYWLRSIYKKESASDDSSA